MMERICKDCRHYKKEFMITAEFAICEAPQNKKASPVTGGATYKFSRFCNVLRVGDIGDCAPVGRWFEQKPPRVFWMRLLFGA